MLTLFTASSGVPLHEDDYYIRELASGLDELIFYMSIWDAEYPLVQEESTIQEHSNDDAPINYIVKAIDGGSERAQIKCQIDLDEWKTTLTVGYDSGSKTVLQIVQSVAPTGWAVVDQSGITYKRTVQLESATPMDVLEQCRSTFVNVTYRFDNVAKVVTILSMANGQNLGAFATRDLNLKENNYKGKSTGFITRLYAYGKDGLSFASINGGKPYVEDFTYSSRVICGYWKDERYTVAANLLADAQAKLADLAVPARSFECNVVDLASVNPQKYGFLDFSLFTVVSLIDQTRSGAKIEHRVIERWRYPYLPEKNKVTLSTVSPRIQSQVAQIFNNIDNPNSVWQQQQRSAQQNAIENATSQITGAKGGNMRAIYDSDGNWTELVVMNTESILTASKLWRFNIGGFGYSPNGYNGPYTTAITMDGAIVADFITTGTLNAALVDVTNLNASNISTGTLSADRIAAHSLGVGKITGSLTGGLSNSWGINFADGTLTIGNISAVNITTGTLSADRIAANSIAVSKLTGSITGGLSNSWEIDLTNGTLTIGNISAANITTGTLSADRIAANSIAVSKLTGSISGGLNSSWEINLTDGTMTIGNLSAANITTGTLSADRIAANSIAVSKLTGSITNSDWEIDLTNGTLTIGTIAANKVTVTDLSAFGATIGGWAITADSINKVVENQYRVFLQAPSSPIPTNRAIVVQKYESNAYVDMFSVTYEGAVYAKNATIEGNITATSGTIGGVTIANGVLSGIADKNIATGGISGGSGGSIAIGTITGGANGNITTTPANSITTDNTSSGINTNLGWGAAYGSSGLNGAVVNGGTAVAHFHAGTIKVDTSLLVVGNLNVGIHTASWQAVTIDGTVHHYLGYD